MLPFCVAPARGDHRGEELKTMKRMILTAALLAGVASGTAWAQSAADAINQR